MTIPFRFYATKDLHQHDDSGLCEFAICVTPLNVKVGKEHIERFIGEAISEKLARSEPK